MRLDGRSLALVAYRRTMRLIPILSVALCLAAFSGCHCGCCSKRVSELNCPTDIRQTHCWCFGEDALFHCPCGPNEEYYGHQPTCWRDWPTTSQEWRDAFCRPIEPGAAYQEEMWHPPIEDDSAMTPGPVLDSPFNDDDTRPTDQSRDAPSSTLDLQQMPAEIMNSARHAMRPRPALDRPNPFTRPPLPDKHLQRSN
jgi:hypothetical protein